MSKPNNSKGKSGMSRRRFGIGLAAGLGGVSIFAKLKSFVKPRSRVSFHEAEFYERIASDKKTSPIEDKK
jgi:hypothetical protein